VLEAGMPGPTNSAGRSWLLLAAAACAIAGLLATGLLVTGCSAGAAHPGRASAGRAAKTKAVQLTITPATGSTNVNTADGVSVTAANGKLTSVSVQAGGDSVAGVMNAAGTSWHSTWALSISTRYTVTATATGSGGRPVTQASSFTTLTPAATFQTMIFEGAGQTYGVGMPIILTFSRPVVDKAAVERALQIQTSKPVVGAWYWDGNQTVDDRPRDDWPANTTISFTGHLNGVEAAPGVFGDHTLTQSFKIGISLIVVASTATHHMELYRNGRLYARWPISTGRPTLPTPNGTYLTIDKANPVLMVGPGYREYVPWSVRFTWTGDYLHDAWWSVGEQGYTNVSHGCVNMPPAAAETYYEMEDPGDPVTITGSPLAGTWDNGWTEWFLSWPAYVKGSALHEAVEAGPQGSVFVNPAQLPPGTATPPLGTSRPGNWHAS
jgi:lipoprotein-anchoring transpeptidase ErfK/SrfK